jgi:MFS family permease
VNHLTKQQRRRGLVAAISVATIAGIGLSMLYPLLSLALERMQVPTTTVGLLATVGSIATLGITPLIPRLMRMFGTLPLLLLATAVAIGCTLSFNAWPDVWIWFPLRFINSSALILLFVVSEIWINQLLEDHNRGRVLGIYVACFSGGAALGPALLYVIGTEGWLPYVAAAAMMAAAALPLGFVRGVTPVFHDAPSMGFTSFLVAAPLAGLGALAYGAAETSLLALLPIYAVRNGLTPEYAALLLSLYGLGNVLLQLPIGWLSDRFDRRRLLLACAVVGAAGGLLMPSLIGLRGLLEPAVVLWGGVVVAMYTIGLGVLGERFRGVDLAAANSAFMFLYGIGMLVGPPASGLAMDIWDPHGLAGSIALLFGLYVAIGATAWIRDPGPARPARPEETSSVAR